MGGKWHSAKLRLLGSRSADVRHHNNTLALGINVHCGYGQS
jgi:hypothetical protein